MGIQVLRARVITIVDPLVVMEVARLVITTAEVLPIPVITLVMGAAVAVAARVATEETPVDMETVTEVNIRVLNIYST